MTIQELIRFRKSVRSWSERQPTRDQVRNIIDAARFAPSANNSQDWRIIAVDDPVKRSRLGMIAGGQTFVGEAPVVLAVCGDGSTGTMRCGMPKAAVDASILIDHITLAAAAEGLGSCWIGHFDQEESKKLLGVPAEWDVVQLLPLGYPADPSAAVKTRKEVNEILNWNAWAK